SWPLIHRGGRKRTNACRRPLNRSRVRERSVAGGAHHHRFTVELEEEMKTSEGESICDFTCKNGNYDSDGFLRSILVVKQEIRENWMYEILL
ncbi:hypothetical protein H5410_050273, partial [Solanum commersonii]